MVGMCERRARNENEHGSLERGTHRLPHVVLVSMPVEVDAAEGEPPRRDAENRARNAVLLPARVRGSAFGEEPRPAIPTSRGRTRLRIEGEHGEKLHFTAGARPAGHRGAERKHTVVGVGRENDDRAHRTIIAALRGGEQEERSRGWRRVVPSSVRRRLRPVRSAYVEWRRRRPLDLGDLRRTTPIDANWGFERGTPIDRVYVERFVGARSGDIHGRVLEIAAPDYTNRFGGGVSAVDILMAEEGSPEATIVGDLTDAPHIPDDSFDCAIVTQTLQFVYDVRASLATLHRILAPGGVLLATVPGLTKISPIEDTSYGEWWHYTGRSLRRLGAEAFGDANVEIETYGNVLAAAGFLYGLAASDLRADELDAHDPLFEVVVGLRAIKRV